MDILLEQTAGNSAGVTACRAAFRLATYSDSLYNGLQAQRASPEYRVARAIVAQKQHQAWPAHGCMLTHTKCRDWLVHDACAFF